MSETLCIRSVQIRASAVYVYMYIYIHGYGHMCAIIVDHAMLRNVGGVRLQPFFIRASRFIVTTGNGTGTKNVLKWNCALTLCLVPSLLSTALLL